MMKNSPLFILFFLCSVLLGSCGGGDDEQLLVQADDEPSKQRDDSIRPVAYAGATFKNPNAVSIDRIIVKLKPVTNSAKALSDEQAAPLRIQTQQSLNLLRQVTDDTYVMALEESVTLTEIIAILNEIQSDPNVAYVEPDWPIYPMLTPTDPGYNNQWHMMASGSVPGAANLPAAWDITTGINDVVVAILDSGIVSTHPDLSTRIVAGYDFIANLSRANDGNGRDNNAEDPGNWCDSPAANSNWHGAQVAGIVGAAANNGQGGVGVDWQARIQSIRVLGKCGGYTSDLVDGIRWAAGLSVNGIADNLTPAKVINLSLGGAGTCGVTLQNAVDDAYNAGSLLIVAAGNEDDDAANYTPAVCNNVITVAAIGRDGQRASYSNYGASVELAAPGGSDGFNVYTTGNDGTQSQNNHVYVNTQGTSLAAPHVAGIASLMLAGNYSLTNSFLSPAILTNKILATVGTFPTSTVRDCNTSLCGVGIVDAAAAVAAVTSVPSVNAGVDQNASNGQLITLNAVVSDDGGGPFSYQWTQTAGNSVTLTGAGTATATFTTAATSEVLTFQVAVTDDVGLIASDAINVSVSGTNTAPVANTASFSITEDLTYAGTLTGSDGDGNALTFTVVVPPTNGSLTAFDGSTGNYSYTPSLNYVGVDSFTFAANDGLANSVAAAVAITVNGVDDPPIAVNETLRVASGSSLQASVRGVDVDGDSLTFALVTSPTEGVVTGFNTNGSFTYTPGEFQGTTQLTFSVDDGNSPPVVGTLTLVVEDVFVVGINASLMSPQAPGALVTFSALANASGVYEYEFWLKGPATSDAWQRQQRYSTNADWVWTTSGADVGNSTVWVYSRLQGSAKTYASGSLIFDIDDGNQAPSATSVSLEAQINTDRQSVLTASDPEEDILTFSLISGPSSGAIITFNGTTGNFVYRPNTGYSGSDSFVYQVTDSAMNSISQTLNITVLAVNDPPVALDGVLSAQPGVSAAGTVVGTDGDGDVLTYALISGPLSGSLIGPNSVSGAFSYRANTGFSGEDSFRFSVDDGKVVSYGTIAITVIEQATALVSASLTSPQASGVSIGIQGSVNGLANPEYEFWLKGPATGGAWQRMQAYSSANTWTWNTSGADVGTSSIWVYTRQSGTTKLHASVSLEYVIN